LGEAGRSGYRKRSPRQGVEIALATPAWIARRGARARDGVLSSHDRAETFRHPAPGAPAYAPANGEARAFHDRRIHGEVRSPRCRARLLGSLFRQPEYREFGLPYDLEVLEVLEGSSWFNVVHIHGDDILFGLLDSYPVQGISWHIWETKPTVEEFIAADSAKCIVGGLRRSMITSDDLPGLAKDVSETMRITGCRRLMLAPGCVVRAPYNKETLRYLRRTIDRAREIRP
jgi:hypothetical protein